MSADWGYDAANGPATWAVKFPQAAGSRQSPIDITTSAVQSDGGLTERPLSVTYDSDKTLSLENSGHGWKVSVNGEGSELKGGPLDDVYKLEQYHCHWGCSSDEGSEHTVNGSSYAGELHLVHWNCSKYSTFAEAASNSDGLAVLGIFLKEGDHHDEMNKIVSHLSKIKHKGEVLGSPGDIDPGKFLPEDRGYWTYQGSLTTPPCTESVTWIVFKKPIEVSEKQLKRFRKLRCHTRTGTRVARSVGDGGASDGDSSGDESSRVVTNYRPTLPLNNRVLRECGSS